MWDLGLILGSGVYQTRRQIVFSTPALRGVRKAVEPVISKLNIPRETVFIEVGCETPDPPSIYPQVSADAPFLDSTKLRMEVPQQASYGEAVPLKLILQNVGDETASFVINGNLPEDFVITTPDGKGVWYWSCSRFGPDAIYGLYMDPGEKREFVDEWEQVNHKGEPVPPGDYLVYGTMGIGPFEPSEFDLYQLETPPHRLEILKP